MRSVKWAACAAVVVLAVSGCGGSEPGQDSKPTGSESAVSSPTAEDSTPGALTAERVSERLAEAIPSFELFRVYTAANDPNDMLGRPGGYTSKTAFYDSRIPEGELEVAEDDAILRGGSVEVFSTEAGARKRYEYGKAISESSSLFAEYDFVSGTVLVRVSKKLTPDQAAEYETALKDIVG